MLTTEPGPDVAPYHNRQILVLKREDWARWLDPRSSCAAIATNSSRAPGPYPVVPRSDPCPPRDGCPRPGPYRPCDPGGSGPRPSALSGVFELSSMQNRHDPASMRRLIGRCAPADRRKQRETQRQRKAAGSWARGPEPRPARSAAPAGMAGLKLGDAGRAFLSRLPSHQVRAPFLPRPEAKRVRRT